MGAAPVVPLPSRAPRSVAPEIWRAHTERHLQRILAVLDVPLDVLRSHRRSKGLARARFLVAVYLQEHAGLRLHDIAAALGRANSSQAFIWVQHGRLLLHDDPSARAAVERALALALPPAGPAAAAATEPGDAG